MFSRLLAAIERVRVGFLALGRWKIGIVLIAPLFFVDSCGSPIYVTHAIGGTVLDDLTHQPLEGAIVLAHWHLERKTGWHGRAYEGQLDVKEVVTDANGQFWLHPSIAVNPTFGQLGNRDPRIFIFKPGYEIKAVSNTDPQFGPIRVASFKGKTHVLRHLVTPPSGDDSVHGNAGEVAEVIRDCRWKDVPQLMRAMRVESARLARILPQVKHDLISVTSLVLERECKPLFRARAQSLDQDREALPDTPAAPAPIPAAPTINPPTKEMTSGAAKSGYGYTVRNPPSRSITNPGRS